MTNNAIITKIEPIKRLNRSAYIRISSKSKNSCLHPTYCPIENICKIDTKGTIRINIFLTVPLKSGINKAPIKNMAAGGMSGSIFFLFFIFAYNL